MSGSRTQRVGEQDTACWGAARSASGSSRAQRRVDPPPLPRSEHGEPSGFGPRVPFRTQMETELLVQRLESQTSGEAASKFYELVGRATIISRNAAKRI